MINNPMRHWLFESAVLQRRTDRCSVKLKLLFVGLMLGACISFSNAANAAAAGNIRAQHSNLCLDVPDETTVNGVQLIQWTCHADTNQQFELIELSGGYYNIRVRHSGKCLNVYGGFSTDGAAIIQWPCSGGASGNDMWRLEAQNGGHRLIARHSGKCLNVYGALRTSGTRMIQWPCDGASNETFFIEALAKPNSQTPLPAMASKGYGTIMLRHSGKCINVPNASTANGVGIIQYTCEGAKHDRFSLRSIGDNAYHIVAEHSGKCLNIDNASRTRGAKVIQWPCQSGVNNNDAFRLESIKGGHRIIARHSGLCLNLEGATAANRANLIQWDCAGADNEIFSIGAVGAKQGGRWSIPVKFPLVPVSAGLMPSGEILTWSAYGPMSFGGDNGYTYSAMYNPTYASVTQRIVSETGHDMFCPGTTQMGDGRLMVTGGSSAGRVSIYDPISSTWARAPDMNKPRAYHSSTVLGDGAVMVVGGSWAGGIGDKGAEVFRHNRWTQLTGISSLPLVGADPAGLYRSDNHMWLFPWTNNRVFQAGPSREMHMISTSGNGSISSKGPRGSDNYAMNGSAVMFGPGRILTTGGAPSYDNGVASANAHIVNINKDTVTTKEVQSMNRPRAFHHSVVLPNGQVLVVGGQETSVVFSDAQSILTPELFNPVTRTFTPMAPMAIPRTYHSVALLMADARVFVAGGGLCGDCQTNHPDAEIFTPPYLLDNAGALRARPRITEGPSRFRHGVSSLIRTDKAVKRFALVRAASATHSVNTDQRRIPLEFTGDVTRGYTVRMPTDPGVAPPGTYMLFALDNKGVPSIAHIAKLGNV